MLLTTREDLNKVRDESGVSWSELGRRLGTNKSNANSLYRSAENIVSRSYIKVVEAIGYDIELRFIKR